MIKTLKIESILDGHSQTQYISGEGTFDSSIAIDPDFPVGSNTKTSGVLVPVRYAKFSGTELTGFPLWIITNTKTTNSFVYTSDGKIHSFDSSLAMRATDEATTALPISITGGAGNGAAYYNNYVYFAEATDVTRYGPLSGGTVAKTENVWTGATLGSLAALTNTTYPSIRGVSIPNHPMHVHTDASLYFGDVVAGQGVVHRINTRKVTVEGDTNGNTVPSAFNVLDLPFGYYPTDIESYGTDLVIAAIQSTDTTINQGNAVLFFWDPTNTDSFYRQVPLPDPLCTALKNVNGILYIWSGNASSGCRISRYIGGDTVSDEAYIEDGVPPFAGAVDALGSRLVHGGYTTYPVASASVTAFGSKNDLLPKGVQNIVKTSSAGSSPIVTCLKYVQQASNIQPKLVVGWKDASTQGLDKISTSATYGSVFRSKIFNINRQFVVKKIRIPLAGTVDANTSIVPKILVDDQSDSLTLNTINNTNFSGKRKAVYEAGEFETLRPENNFMLELTWGGTTEMPVLLPIEIDVDISEEDQ